jgi:hypothetical protein
MLINSRNASCLNKALVFNTTWSHRGGPGSRLCQSMWDLWWKKWHWDRIFSESFGFPLSVSFHRGCPYRISSRGLTIVPLVAAVQRLLSTKHYDQQYHLNGSFSLILIWLMNYREYTVWKLKSTFFGFYHYKPFFYTLFLSFEKMCFW